MRPKALNRKNLLYLLLIANVLTLIIAMFTSALDITLTASAHVRNGVLLYVGLALVGAISSVIGAWVSIRFARGKRDQPILLSLCLIIAGLAMIWWFLPQSIGLMLYYACAFYQQCL